MEAGKTQEVIGETMNTLIWLKDSEKRVGG